MKKNVLFLFILVVPGLTLSFLIQAQGGAQESGLLAKVRSRGQLICGINSQLPGFGDVVPKTKVVSRFDTDFCCAVAEAIFGKADAVTFKLVAD